MSKRNPLKTAKLIPIRETDLSVGENQCFTGEYELYVPPERGKLSDLATRALVMSIIGQKVYDLLQKWGIEDRIITYRGEWREGDTLPTKIAQRFKGYKKGKLYVLKRWIDIKPGGYTKIVLYGKPK